MQNPIEEENFDVKKEYSDAQNMAWIFPYQTEHSLLLERSEEW